ncbi:MAG: hypothetical protein AB7V40_11075, partial [Methyloceanibacter sp.]
MTNDAGDEEPRLAYGSITVPTRLLGCWYRRSIRFADGGEDSSTRVIWVQTLSGVGDIRVSATRPDLRTRGGLEDCSTEELLALAEQDCFCGVTLFDAKAEPYPTARWPKESYLFRFQPVITFPEPGWMEWLEGGTCMIERAPSRAYVEDWRLQPGSRRFGAHLVRRDAPSLTTLYVAGDHAILARDRLEALSPDKTLPELARASRYDPKRLRALLDCEFSYARRAEPMGEYVIELSTLPWREGQTLDCPPVEALSPRTTGSEE